MEIPGGLPWQVKTSLFFFILLIGIFHSAAQSPDQQEEIQFFRDLGIQPLTNAEQEGVLAPGTYLIQHDIMIPGGRQMTIPAGTRILLTQNAMVVVNGTLVCSGTRDAPVVFEKLKNRDYFRPIDPRLETRWDGIYLPDQARLKMSNTVISDSKYGIVISGKDVAMSFDSVRFTNNKFQNVKIGERMMKIAENTPILFHYPEQQGVFVEPVAVKNATETIQQYDNGRRKTAYPQLRVGMAITGGLGLVIGAWGGYMYQKYFPLSENHPGNEEYRSKLRAGQAASIGGAILFGVGAVGFTMTLFF